MSSAEVPAFYKQLALETDDYAILEVPGFAAANYMYFQTIHGKKLVNGYVSRTPDYVLEFASRVPLISNIISRSDTPIMEDITKKDVIKQNRTELISILSNYNIKYIIIHKNYLSDSESSFASNLVHDSLGIEPMTYNSDGLLVYHIPASLNSPPLRL
jgi:hypothetical protein